MPRPYTKTRRAEKEAATRERIVDAALDLHGKLGPNRTTISMIAERAGVQRHTVYSHFPDERTLLMACSGLHLERAPLPSPEAWATINDPEARLRAALSALYGWFAENEGVTATVLRDAQTNTVLAEISGMRFGAAFGAIIQSLADGLDGEGQAALALALSFYTWRSLVRESKLSLPQAVQLMVRTILRK
jgi:AcrR family transcriptional regulator